MSKSCAACGASATCYLGNVLLCRRCYVRLRGQLVGELLGRIKPESLTLWVKRRAARLVERRCGICDKPLDPKLKVGAKYCPGDCRRIARNETARVCKEGKRPLRLCDVCREEVPRGRVRYCSDDCMRGANRAGGYSNPKLKRAASRLDALHRYGGIEPACSRCGSTDRLVLHSSKELGGGRRGYHLYNYLKRVGWPAGPRVMCVSCVGSSVIKSNRSNRWKNSSSGRWATASAS